MHRRHQTRRMSATEMNTGGRRHLHAAIIKAATVGKEEGPLAPPLDVTDDAELPRAASACRGPRQHRRRRAATPSRIPAWPTRAANAGARALAPSTKDAAGCRCAPAGGLSAGTVGRLKFRYLLLEQSSAAGRRRLPARRPPPPSRLGIAKTPGGFENRYNLQSFGVYHWNKMNIFVFGSSFFGTWGKDCCK